MWSVAFGYFLVVIFVFLKGETGLKLHVGSVSPLRNWRATKFVRVCSMLKADKLRFYVI